MDADAIKIRDPQSPRSDSGKDPGISTKKRGESKMCRVALSLSLSIISPDRPDDSNDRYGGENVANALIFMEMSLLLPPRAQMNAHGQTLFTCGEAGGSIFMRM